MTLVHGDMKSGNFAFDDHDDVSAVFSWELATVGDPLNDVGYADVLWCFGSGITSVPGAPTADEFVACYEELTKTPFRHREWYRAMQAFKLAVILLFGSMHYARGFTDDRRFAEMARGIPVFTEARPHRPRIHEDLHHGPVSPRAERLVRGFG